MLQDAWPGVPYRGWTAVDVLVQCGTSTTARGSPQITSRAPTD